MSLQKTNMLKRKSGLPWQHISGQSLILNPEKHEAHELNEVASFVWSQLDGETHLAQIIEQISTEYDVDSKELDTDILVVAQKFVDLELVECL